MLIEFVRANPFITIVFTGLIVVGIQFVMDAEKKRSCVSTTLPARFVLDPGADVSIQSNGQGVLFTCFKQVSLSSSSNNNMIDITCIAMSACNK
jgi:hypothetical protein